MKEKISKQEVKLKALRHNPGVRWWAAKDGKEVRENVGEQ